MNNEDAIFRTLTGEDWKRGLALARATPNDISLQINKALAKDLSYRDVSDDDGREVERHVEHSLKHLAARFRH